MKSVETRKKAGRPREFDAVAALDAAMCVFWRKGYEGTSLSDLTDAMGINRPSMYAAFGNKEDLFRKVLERYQAGRGSILTRALNEPTARAAVASLLTSMADSLTDPLHPGCLAVQGALACGDDSANVRQELCATRATMQRLLQDRFARARDEGDLPADTDPGDLAAYVTSLTQGMAVQATGGATREDLLRVAELALRAVPGGQFQNQTRPDRALT